MDDTSAKVVIDWLRLVVNFNQEFGLRVNSTKFIEGITKINYWGSSINKYDEVLNLASDPKKHFNLSLLIMQYWTNSH